MKKIITKFPLQLIALVVVVFSVHIVSAQETRINSNTCIKIETGTVMNIAGGGDLILDSDASTDASLIDLGTVIYTGGGETQVKRYLTDGKWHLISSPINNVIANLFLGDYLQYHTESTNQYTDVAATNYQLNIMRGYSLWSIESAPSTETFVGTTNTGTKNISFTKTGSGDASGWNLVGNPYPSTIDWDAVTIPVELDGAIWLFDPTVGANGDYKYYISGGGAANTTSQYIPSSQGFFVRATGGSGALQFENSSRVHGGQAFYKNTNANSMLILKASGNSITTQTAIRFLDDATPQIDRLYDVNKIVTNSQDVPVIYSICENQNMAINSLPSIEGHEIVPIRFEAGTSGSYVIEAAEMESLGLDVPVFLEDVALNYKHDLRLNPQYTFEYESGEAKLFNVYFKNANGIEEQNEINVQCYLSNNVLHVNIPESEFQNDFDNATISVYSIAGQKLLSTQPRVASTNIPFYGSQSIYLVSVITNNGVFLTKVMNNSKY